jgi:hypothetical protein
MVAQMTNRVQDLEQEVLLCWQVCEDLLLLAKEHEDNDEFCNKVLGLKHVYDMRFRKAWDTYEYVVDEYYTNKKEKA